MQNENEDFPEEIIRPIKALNDENRRRIVLALSKKCEFSYSEIKDQFKIKKGTLTHHLHELVSAGLIRNFTKTLPDSRHTSYYELTDFGLRFIDGLNCILEPKAENIVYMWDSPSTSQDPLIGNATSGEILVTTPNRRFKQK
jgi:DNA-binding transcriptional ArsR family regulator